MPNLIDLKIQRAKGVTKSVVEDLMSSISMNGRRLLKLKISSVNINYSEPIETFCELIQKTQMLQTIELSWCCLSPKNLAKIAESLN